MAVTDAELDNDTYEAAEKQYLQNNTKQSITGFSGYVAKFPRGIHSLKANYYLAQSYFSDGQEDKSVSGYEYVIAQPRSEFTEQSLVRLAQIFLKNNDTSKAISVLGRLEKEADVSQNKTFAQSNLMKSYYENKDYSNSVLYAEKVLANPKTDDNVKSDAQIIIARAAIQTGDETKASCGLCQIAKRCQRRIGCRSLVL